MPIANIDLARVTLPLLLGLAAGLGCTQPPSPASESSPLSPTPSTLATGEVPAAALRAACASTCVRPENSIQVYRDERGSPGRLLAQGTGCAHAPAFYYDMSGVATETIANKPVVVGSAEAAAFQERRERQLRGLHPAERVRCSELSSAP